METRTRAAVYVRISKTAKSQPDDAVDFIQNPEVQEQPLRDLVTQRGWNLHQVYNDRASGAKQKRPGRAALMADAKRRLFDVVVIWRFDRLANSVKQLVETLEEFRTLRIDLVTYQDAFDTTAPTGEAVFATIAAIAKFERNVITERIVADLDRVEQYGTRSGRPVGRPPVTYDRDRVAELRGQGCSWRSISKKLGVPVSTIRPRSARSAASLATPDLEGVGA